MLSFTLAVAMAAQVATAPPPRSKDADASATTAPVEQASARPKPSVPPGEIQGVILLPDGRPAERARVALLPTFQPGRAPLSPLMTTADEAGAFRFEAARIPSFTIVAHRAPFALTALPRQRLGRRVTLRLEAGGSVSGLVLDANTGRPLSNASIEASEWDVSPYLEVDPDFGMVRASSDAQGAFTLKGLPPSGRLFARARLRGYATGAVTSVPPGGLKIRLGPGHNLEGIITDVSGRPVPKAVVSLKPTTRTLGSVTVRSRENGRFEAMGLRNIPYDATVTADGFAPFVKDAMGVDVTSLRVTLEPPSRVTGRFVDEADRPLQGVVRVRSWQGEATPSEIERLLTTETRRDGTFAVSGLKVGANGLDLRAEGFPRIERRVEIAKAGEEIALGDVRFEGGLVIRGRLATKEDAPVPGARLTATRVHRTGPLPPEPFYSQSDDDGRFELRSLDMEAYQLSISAEGYARQTMKATPSDEAIAIVMRPVIPVSGRLVDASGQPVAVARLSAQKGSDIASSTSAQSTADGRFSLDLSESGDIVLTVTAEGFTSLNRTLHIETALDLGDIALSRGLRVKGVVMDGKGAPVSGARIENQTTRQFPVTFAESDDKGRFELSGVNPGRVRLAATHFQYSPSQTYVEVAEGEEPDEARIVLGAGGRVEGSVRHRDGTPVGQALIQLFAQNPNDPLRPPSSGVSPAITTADGSFVFEHVFPGSMSVVLMTGQQGAYTNVDQTAITVSEGETVPVNLTLRTTTVRGLLRRNGESPAGLRVTMRGSNVMMMGGQMRLSSLTGEIPWHSAIADTEGRFALRIVGPVSGQVAVASVDRPITLLSRTVEIPDADEYQMTLDLAGTRVSGRTVDIAENKGLGEATVQVKTVPPESPQAKSWFARSDGTGSFAIELEPGEYQLTAGAEGYALSAPVKLSVAASEVALGDIGLSRGGTISGRATLAGQPVSQARIDAAVQGSETLQTRYSGPDGYFTVSGLPDAPVRLVASDNAGHVGMQVVTPGSTDPVEVKLGPAARLNILVVGPRESLQKIDVTIPRVDGIGSTGWSRADVNGRATLFALPGETRVRASAEGLFGETVVQTQAGETTEVVVEVKAVRRPASKD